MLHFILTLLLLHSDIFVSAQSLCPKGETGYNGECKRCPANCRHCLSAEACLLCDTGYYQFKSCRPCPTGCAECSSLKICKKCNTGYFLSGSRCTKCTSPCKACKSADHCIKCNDGWKLNGNVCHKCSKGFFEFNSECLPCPNNCESCLRTNECVKCNAEGGACEFKCKQGFWGKFCENHCSDNCLLNKCHVENGTCELGCKERYHGVKCECIENLICNATINCAKGTFGSQCGKQCIHNCSNCDSETGKCLLCKNSTFYGSYCNKECNKNCIDRVCRLGKCEYGCKPGYFGERCQIICSKPCINNACNRVTGICDHVLLEDAPLQGNEELLLKPVDTIYLLTCFSVAVVYAFVITAVLIRYRDKHRRQVDTKDRMRELVENEYEPAVFRNTICSDHMYTTLEETSSRSLPLAVIENMETGPRNSSTEVKEISPVLADTRPTNDYQEII